MKLPSFEEAATALGALTGFGPQISAATGVVKIVIDLFDDKPDDQEKLKAQVRASFASAGAALDELDAAIEEAKAKL